MANRRVTRLIYSGSRIPLSELNIVYYVVENHHLNSLLWRIFRLHSNPRAHEQPESRGCHAKCGVVCSEYFHLIAGSFGPIAILFSVCALGKTWSVKIGNESTSSPPPEFIETVLSNPSDSLGFYCLKHLLKLDMIIPNFKEIAYLKCKKHKVLRQQWRQRR